MISFTVDIDWAPEIVIEDTISLFEEYDVKCTFFSTHYSEVLSKCDKKKFEIAVHPDFSPLMGGISDKSVEDIIDELLDIHPDALGVRSHLLHQSTRIQEKFAEKKFLYEANQFLPYQKGIKPYILWNKMVCVPFSWEDDVHWTYGNNFESSGIDLKDNDFVVFDFHPINIFLNIENKYRFNTAKKYLMKPDKLLAYRNNEIKGTRNLLVSLFEYCKVNKITTQTQLEIAEDFLRENTLS